MTLLSLFALGLLGCSSPAPDPEVQAVLQAGAAALPGAPAKTEAARVLVVINRASRESQEVGGYYVRKRAVPRENVVFVDVPAADEMALAEYRDKIEKPVVENVSKNKNQIDFMVLTKGVPFRIREGGYSVDAFLSGMFLSVEPAQRPEAAEFRRVLSPYFNQDVPFSSRRFNMYLVTRLDGYTAEDAKKLVDNALAAKPSKGPFLLDMAENAQSGGYRPMQDTLPRAADVLRKAGFQVVLDEGKPFAGSKEPLAGYASWGSNDHAFNVDVYRSLRFQPGALAETFVSTSARSFSPQKEGQSMIADLIAGGVTGVKGYVSEPYTVALAKPDILFDRYTRGYNLAESFYAASMLVKWKDVVVGDPLCRPYPRR